METAVALKSSFEKKVALLETSKATNIRGGSLKDMYYIQANVEEKKGNTLTITSKLYGSILKLTEKKYADEYQKIKKNGCEKIASELEKVLHEQGFLLCKEEVDKEIRTMEDRKNKYFMLTILPTEACNFRCPYCYETHEAVTMDTERLKSIEKLIRKESEHFEGISINWFGGEPSLCKESVLKINHVAQEVTNYNFYSSMTTNGYLLDRDTFLKYYESGIKRYQITLDGWKHNETRPLKNGTGTLEKIVENLDAIHRLPTKYQFEIVLRHNILKDNADTTWYDYLDKKYGDDGRFSILIRSVGDWGGESVKELDLFEQEAYERTLKQHIEYVDNLKIQLDNKKIDDIDELGKEACYSSYRNHFVIRASGKVEKCTVALDVLENEVGFLDMEGNLHIDKEKNEVWSQTILEDKCYHCKNLFSCMNQKCPLKRIQGNKCGKNL